MALVWDKVTWYSKFAAVLFFLLILPLWAFCLGRYYEESLLSIEKELNGPIESEKQNNKNSSLLAGAIGAIQGQAKIESCSNGNQCKETPYKAYIAVLNQNNKVITETVAVEDGSFTLVLPEGEYTIMKADNSSTLPFLPPQKISVIKNKITKIILEFESSL